MKRMKKLIAALLLCVLVLSCAGCANLDEMKEEHAVWKNENQTELEWNGATYKKLPTSSMLELWDYSEKDVFVTTADVPTLLSDQFGMALNCSKDEVLLESTHWAENDYPVYYCRADQYDEVVKQMVEGVSLDLMIYDFWSFETGENTTYTLTAEQMNAVEAVLKTQPTPLGVNGYEEDYSVYLYRSSQNYLFRERIGTLIALNGEYRIIASNESEDLCYSVPAELKPQFDRIFKKYMDEYQNV